MLDPLYNGKKIPTNSAVTTGNYQDFNNHFIKTAKIFGGSLFEALIWGLKQVNRHTTVSKCARLTRKGKQEDYI